MGRPFNGAAASRLTDLMTIADAYALLGRPAFRSGVLYTPAKGRVFATSSAWVVGTARAAAFYVDRVVTVTSLAGGISSGPSGANGTYYIYGSDQNGQITGSPLITASIAWTTSNQGAVSAALSSNVTLPPGLYWCIFNCDTASTTFSAFGADAFHMNVIGSTALNNLRLGQLSYTLSLAYGTSPGANPTLTEANSVFCPVPSFKVF